MRTDDLLSAVLLPFLSRLSDNEALRFLSFHSPNGWLYPGHGDDQLPSMSPPHQAHSHCFNEMRASVMVWKRIRRKINFSPFFRETRCWGTPMGKLSIRKEQKHLTEEKLISYHRCLTALTSRWYILFLLPVCIQRRQHMRNKQSCSQRRN